MPRDRRTVSRTGPLGCAGSERRSAWGLLIVRWRLIGRQLLNRQPVQRAGGTAQMFLAAVQVDHRGCEAGVAKQFADRQQIDPGLQEPRGVRMSQCVRRDILVDVRRQGRSLDRFLDRGVGVGLVG